MKKVFLTLLFTLLTGILLYTIEFIQIPLAISSTQKINKVLTCSKNSLLYVFYSYEKNDKNFIELELYNQNLEKINQQEIMFDQSDELLPVEINSDKDNMIQLHWLRYTGMNEPVFYTQLFDVLGNPLSDSPEKYPDNVERHSVKMLGNFNYLYSDIKYNDNQRASISISYYENNTQKWNFSLPDSIKNLYLENTLEDKNYFYFVCKSSQSLEVIRLNKEGKLSGSFIYNTSPVITKSFTNIYNNQYNQIPILMNNDGFIVYKENTENLADKQIEPQIDSDGGTPLLVNKEQKNDSELFKHSGMHVKNSFWFNDNIVIHFQTLNTSTFLCLSKDLALNGKKEIDLDNTIIESKKIYFFSPEIKLNFNRQTLLISFLISKINLKNNTIQTELCVEETNSKFMTQRKKSYYQIKEEFEFYIYQNSSNDLKIFFSDNPPSGIYSTFYQENIFKRFIKASKKHLFKKKTNNHQYIKTIKFYKNNKKLLKFYNLSKETYTFISNNQNHSLIMKNLSSKNFNLIKQLFWGESTKEKYKSDLILETSNGYFIFWITGFHDTQQLSYSFLDKNFKVKYSENLFSGDVFFQNGMFPLISKEGELKLTFGQDSMNRIYEFKFDKNGKLINQSVISSKDYDDLMNLSPDKDKTDQSNLFILPDSHQNYININDFYINDSYLIKCYDDRNNRKWYYDLYKNDKLLKNYQPFHSFTYKNHLQFNKDYLTSRENAKRKIYIYGDKDELIPLDSLHIKGFNQGFKYKNFFFFSKQVHNESINSEESGKPFLTLMALDLTSKKYTELHKAQNFTFTVNNDSLFVFSFYENKIAVDIFEVNIQFKKALSKESVLIDKEEYPYDINGQNENLYTVLKQPLLPSFKYSKELFYSEFLKNINWKAFKNKDPNFYNFNDSIMITTYKNNNLNLIIIKK